MHDMKMQHMKMQHKLAGSGKMQDWRMWHKTTESGKCRNGKKGTRKVWNAVCQITFVGRL